MSIVTYFVSAYLMMCIAVFAVVRACVMDRILRTTFVLIGCLAPGFIVYILYRTTFHGDRTSPEDAHDITTAAEWIEGQRQKKFGDKMFPFRHRLKIEYVRTLDKTAETIERVVQKAA